MSQPDINFAAIRAAIANFELSPRVEPNETISIDRAFLPEGHRGVLDLKRQLVVGNRGMGKSFWTHALLSPELRSRLAETYRHRLFEQVSVVIGFNGSTKVAPVAPTTDEILSLLTQGNDPQLIWRGVILRAAWSISKKEIMPLRDTMEALKENPNLYSEQLSHLDDQLGREKAILLVVFDALDRLAPDWRSIRALSRALLILAIGLQSFSSIRAKIFMRVDQFSDPELFRFPDSSKIRNDHVNLVWQPNELYGLLLFEILRDPQGRANLKALASHAGGERALPLRGADSAAFIREQSCVINGIAGEFMGTNKKRGRVYTWVPLHLSDAANTCSPRSFLVAWKKAAEHSPAPEGRAVDHLGLQDGVRSASTSRLRELYEDYPWIEPTLGALRRQFVPMDREQLFELWEEQRVVPTIMAASREETRNLPVGFLEGEELAVLLTAMKSVAVMEERANGKINVPDIFRVEAQILRRGGVAVPPRRF